MSLTIMPAAAPSTASAPAAASGTDGVDFAAVLAGSTDAAAPVAMPRGDAGGHDSPSHSGSNGHGRTRAALAADQPTRPEPTTAAQPATVQASAVQAAALQTSAVQAAAAQATAVQTTVTQPAASASAGQNTAVAATDVSQVTAQPAAARISAAQRPTGAARPGTVDPRPAQAASDAPVATAPAASASAPASALPTGTTTPVTTAPTTSASTPTTTAPTVAAPSAFALPVGFTPVQPSQTTPADTAPQVTAAITELAATAAPTPQLRPVNTPAPTTIPVGKPGATKPGTNKPVAARPIATTGTHRPSGADLDGGVFTVRDRQALRDLVGTPDEHLPVVRAFEAALADQQSAPVATPVPAGTPPLANAPVNPAHVAPTPTTYVPASAQPLPQQLAAPLLKLRAGGDGSHLMIIALHPAELGPVDVHVRITGDAMTIQLAGGLDAHDTLRDALPQLRQELQAAGLSTVGLSLGTNSSDAGSANQYNANPNPNDGGRQAREQTAARYPAPEVARERVPRPQTSTGLDRWL